jgi:multisubunit Na+/H+ antiporter MnhB subunit
MQEPVAQVDKPKNVVSQVLISALALLLLWLSFRGTDLQELWRYSQNVKPLPVLVMVLVGILGAPTAGPSCCAPCRPHR